MGRGVRRQRRMRGVAVGWRLWVELLRAATGITPASTYGTFPDLQVSLMPKSAPKLALKGQALGPWFRFSPAWTRPHLP